MHDEDWLYRANDLRAIIQEMPPCPHPNCHLPVIRVIAQIGKPTEFYHEQNNQPDLIHKEVK